MHERTFLRKSNLGFSLVELLVATAITLISLLIIVQVFSVYEGWKRTTTGTAQGQEGGLLGAFSIERDLRNAGFGMIGLGCAKINAYHANHNPNRFTLPQDVDFPNVDFRVNGTEVTSPIPVAIPVTIVQNSPLSGTDRINVLYGSSPFGNIRVTVQQAMTDSSVDPSVDPNAKLMVNNGVGFNQGDLIIISQPPRDCSILQLSQPAQATGVANVTGTGTSWYLPHNPTGENIFPTGGYAVGARVLNLGQLVDRSYYVENNVLRMAERNLVNGTLTSYDLIPGVIGLHARYGRDTTGDGVLDGDFVPGTTENREDLRDAGATGINTLVAVQISLIVRSGNWEKTEVSPAAIAYWPNGPTVALSADERHYRYRVFQTIVPLKNMIWNN